MYKTLGGYNWSDLFTNIVHNQTESLPDAPLKSSLNEHLTTSSVNVNAEDQQFDIPEKSIFESAKELQSSFHGLKAVSFISPKFENNKKILLLNISSLV